VVVGYGQHEHFLASDLPALLPETRSEMALPLIVGERVLGVFDVQSEAVNRFTEEDLRVQTTLAGQVAVALQNANLMTGQPETAGLAGLPLWP